MVKQEKKKGKESGNGRMNFWQSSEKHHQVTLKKMRVGG
jgi:hypothetical protein